MKESSRKDNTKDPISTISYKSKEQAEIKHPYN